MPEIDHDHDAALYAARSLAVYLGRSDEIAEKRMRYVIVLAEQAKGLAEALQRCRVLAWGARPDVATELLKEIDTALASYEERKR